MHVETWGRRALWAAVAAATAGFLISCGGDDNNPTPPPTFSTTLVVGASLSDTGNACAASAAACPPAPPYAAGRFSNGPLWVEAVAAAYGGSANPSLRGGSNFAYAGARTGSVQAALNAAGLTMVTVSAATGTAPSVPGINAALGTTPSQIDQLLARQNFAIAPQTLVVVDASTFGNNISDALTLSVAFPMQAAQIPTAVVTGGVTDIVTVINRLYAAGARNILVVNAPNVGATPRVQALGMTAATGATQLSAGFNGALAQQVTTLRAVLTGANIVLFDLFALEGQIKAGAAPGGFTLGNLTAACFTTVPAVAVCATPQTYFYWDSFHPTAALGAYVATRVIAALPTP
jgi:outer membrane lipase/esterase